jgi:hypothetical protein
MIVLLHELVSNPVLCKSSAGSWLQDHYPGLRAPLAVRIGVTSLPDVAVAASGMFSSNCVFNIQYAVTGRH